MRCAAGRSPVSFSPPASWPPPPPAGADDPAAYPPPAPLKNESNLGLHIQRTMTLLATSTPKHHNKVRILFYGQSITEQDWSKQVADDLRRRFPDADLEIENRAIGGFAAQLLIRPAEHDLYPFYPDLLIFHVYGSNKEYEDIIRSTRSRTTAEVLMQKDHVTKWPPDVIDKDKDKGMWWDDLMNNHLLPDIAKKYGCGLVDIRGQWLDYLRDEQAGAERPLKGRRSPQRPRQFPHGRDRRAVSEVPARSARRRVEGPGADLRGRQRRRLEGRPADAAVRGQSRGRAGGENGRQAGGRAVRIDGKKPSEFPGAYRITRPAPGPWSPLTVSRIDHDAPLVPEEWTLKITKERDGGKAWDFEVTGSVTGPDGGGASDASFMSKSGRVKIEPGAWFHPEGAKVPAGYEIKWSVLPMGIDSYQAPRAEDETRDHPTTLAQGIPNEKHTLELTADGDAAIRAVRVYRPPVR